MNMFEKNLSTKLRSLRVDRDLTQEDVAVVLKITRSAYCYYETGKTQPSIESVVKLCSFYQIELDELFFT